MVQEHSVSVSSGTDRFQTYASTSYLKDNGQTIGNSVERFTGNFRMNFKMSDKIRGEILSSGSVRNQRAPGTELRVSEPVYGSYIRGFDINPYNFVLNTSRMITPYDENGNLEYFTNKPGIIETGNKEIVLRLLDPSKVKKQKANWQFINIGLPVLLVLLFAWIYQQLRKKNYA